jgi:hypothetical protein
MFKPSKGRCLALAQDSALSYIFGWLVWLARGLLIALMMVAPRSPETLVNFYQTTRRYNPEDSHLHRLLTVSLDAAVN